MKKRNIKVKFGSDMPTLNTSQARRDIAMCKAINLMAQTIDELIEEVNCLKKELSLYKGDYIK